MGISRYAIQANTKGFLSVPEYLSILINKLWLYAIQLIPDKMHKGDILSSNTNNLYNSDRVPLIHLDQLPKILICKFVGFDINQFVFDYNYRIITLAIWTNVKRADREECSMQPCFTLHILLLLFVASILHWSNDLRTIKPQLDTDFKEISDCHDSIAGWMQLSIGYISSSNYSELKRMIDISSLRRHFKHINVFAWIQWAKNTSF